MTSDPLQPYLLLVLGALLAFLPNYVLSRQRDAREREDRRDERDRQNADDVRAIGVVHAQNVLNTINVLVADRFTPKPPHGPTPHEEKMLVAADHEVQLIPDVHLRNALAMGLQDFRRWDELTRDPAVPPGRGSGVILFQLRDVLASYVRNQPYTVDALIAMEEEFREYEITGVRPDAV